ncbi:hypothetical protein BKA56DRAFT_597011 [Ilyonectria sp. MPI-CAGE-AT-0026]|nr:hypothetical protein BKA56DRAFT_597011 [Ilyonectria sp. MPI-CAGE-AT-0026]
MSLMHIRPWCGLCGFEFAQGEDVLVVTQDNLLSLRLKYFSTGLEEDEEEDENSEAEAEQDEEPEAAEIDYYFPSLGEMSQDRQAVGCHLGCIESQQLDDTSRPEFVNMVKNDYVPSLFELNRRQRWLQARFTNVLCHTYGFNGDVSRMVVQHCLSALTLAHTVHMSKMVAVPAGITSVLPTGPLWARYVIFQGVSYIAVLSNERPRIQEQEEQYIVHSQTCGAKFPC